MTTAQSLRPFLHPEPFNCCLIPKPQTLNPNPSEPAPPPEPPPGCRPQRRPDRGAAAQVSSCPAAAGQLPGSFTELWRGRPARTRPGLHSHTTRPARTRPGLHSHSPRDPPLRLPGKEKEGWVRGRGPHPAQAGARRPLAAKARPRAAPARARPLATRALSRPFPHSTYRVMSHPYAGAGGARVTQRGGHVEWAGAEQTARRRSDTFAACRRSRRGSGSQLHPRPGRGGGSITAAPLAWDGCNPAWAAHPGLGGARVKAAPAAAAR